MLSDHCPVCLSVCLLSVTFVHCGQTAGRIKMKLGMQVGLGPGHIVLDGTQPSGGITCVVQPTSRRQRCTVPSDLPTAFKDVFVSLFIWLTLIASL